MRGRLLVTITLLALAVAPASAIASWNSNHNGSGYGKAKTMPAGNTPTASVSGRNVTVNWTASSGSVPVLGYLVKRYDTNGNVQTIGASCSGTINGTSCTESGVASGNWKYSVTPVNNNWRGAESSQSSTTTVESPNLSLTGANSLTSLPATLSGQITNYVAGQTVTFRLDNPSTGTVLSGSITPSPVPTNGTASVSVTIPAGTASGSHRVYAVGSGSDTAWASIGVTSSFSVSPRKVSNTASGTEVDNSDPFSFASDTLYDTSGNWSGSFASNRYFAFDYSSPLTASGSTSSVDFNLTYSANGADTACYYFEVKRISTGNVIGTHGSSASPVDCVTGTTFKTVTTSLSEVTSTAIANDLEVKVYAKVSGNHPWRVDAATVTGSTSGLNFTLYETSTSDAADGSATTTPWSLYSADTTTYLQTGAWPTSASDSKYEKFTLPGYVPTGAGVRSVNFKHSYVQSGGGSSCYYFDVIVNGSVIGTHGSAGSPVSCNASSSVWQTDTVSLPEVNTRSEANNVVVKMYMWNTGGKSTRSDLAQLNVDYVVEPTLDFSSSTSIDSASLPATLSGDISTFASGQTVAFKLDSPTGTALSGSITPSTVPASGTAAASVTIPAGTSAGDHTVYAVGSDGDVASASINVYNAYSLTTPAWTISDVSSGTASDLSDRWSASGGAYYYMSGFQPSFDTNRFIDLDYNGPLRSGQSTSGLAFKFDYVGTDAAFAAGANTCFYFEVRRISTGNVLATHGSAASPVDCVNQFSFKTTSTDLPEVTSSDIANDLRIRVFMTNAATGYNFIDRATLTGNQDDNAFTLYRTRRVDQATGTPATNPWALNAAGDSTFLTNGTNWPTSFNTGKYLELTFPSYVPSGASAISATFKHAYKSNTAGATTCVYYEVYNGATLIGSHGSSASPASCNSSSTSTVTDTVSLPEVDTISEANGVIVRIYVKTSAASLSDHDLAELKVDYHR